MRSLILLLTLFVSINGFALEKTLDGAWGAWGRLSCVDKDLYEWSNASLFEILADSVAHSRLSSTVKTYDYSHDGLILKFRNGSASSLFLFGGWSTTSPRNLVSEYVLTKIESQYAYSLSPAGKLSLRYTKSHSVNKFPDFMKGNISDHWDDLTTKLKNAPYTRTPGEDLISALLNRTEIFSQSQTSLVLKMNFDAKNPADKIFSDICDPRTSAIMISFSAECFDCDGKNHVDR